MIEQQTVESQDRRELQRFKLRLQAILQELRDRDAALELYTRDISSDGAFFYTNSPLPLDSDVELTLVLPFGQAAKSQVKVDGRVIRAEQDGIAVRFDSRYSLKPA